MRWSSLATCVLVAWAAAALQAQAPTVTSSIGMELVLISPGTTLVGRFQPQCPRPPDGSATNQADTVRGWTAEDYARCEALVKRDALPGFTATISQPFYIGKYEVTQAEWKRVMGTNPSVYQGSRVRGDASRHPVDNVTWADAQAFVRRLNALEPGARYRLPTEFEWEYAARAGVTGEPSWDDIRANAWQADADLGGTHPVGTKPANAWGLHDTLGNVWEWVADYYNERLFADSVPPASGKTHVLKGGSFISDVKNATWSTHAGGPGSGFDVGLRVVREVGGRGR